MLSRTTLAAKQIDDRVRVIVTEVGPGSNVSRLDETQKLNTIGKTAEDILVAAKPLSGQAQQIIDTAKSIDNTVSAINANAAEINSTVHSINATASALLPVVKNINGDNTISATAGGVAAINMRAAAAAPVVNGISTDLLNVAEDVGAGGLGGHTAGTIHVHVNSINCALTSPSGGLVGAVGGLLNTLLGSVSGAPVGCNAF
jgi:methyl-accepting chemotaxis protein